MGPVLVYPPVIRIIIFGLTSIFSKYEHKFQIDTKIIYIKLKIDNQADEKAKNHGYILTSGSVPTKDMQTHPLPSVLICVYG